MAVDYKIFLGQVVTSNLQPITVGNYYLRAEPFSANTYTGTHIGDGVWSFGTVNDNLYQLWDGSSQVTKYGTQWIGDKTPTFTTVIVTGDITTANLETTTAVKTDSVVERTINNGINVDGVVLKDGGGKRLNGSSESDNDIVFKDGTQTISGAKTFSGGIAISGGAFATGSATAVTLNCDNDNAHPKGNVYNIPATDNHFAQRKYVDDKVSQINVTPYQEASTKRRVIWGGTVETGKVYQTIAQAVATLSGISASNPATIEVVRAGGTLGGFSLAGGISVLPSTTTQANILFKGQGRITGILYSGSVTMSASTHFEDCTIYFSNVDTAGARTITNARFTNCTLIFYNDVTFGNGVVIQNCDVLIADTFDATLTGTAQMKGVIFNQGVADTTSVDQEYTDEFISALTLPTDPVSIPS